LTSIEENYGAMSDTERTAMRLILAADDIGDALKFIGG
jgi:hypothetical protein